MVKPSHDHVAQRRERAESPIPVAMTKSGGKNFHKEERNVRANGQQLMFLVAS